MVVGFAYIESEVILVILRTFELEGLWCGSNRWFTNLAPTLHWLWIVLLLAMVCGPFPVPMATSPDHYLCWLGALSHAGANRLLTLLVSPVCGCLGERS